jgi:outer membrane immunogenic protein
MNNLMMTVLAFTLFATVTRAQDAPEVDVAGGYSVIQVVKGISATGYGGSGSAALNVNNWLGVVGDVGLYHSSPFGPGLDAGTYTFGPRVSYRHWGRFTPFGQVLLGGVRYADNGFVFGAGGGADIGLDSGGRFALRPQVEYFGFRANGNITNTVRVSVGIVFRIGKK